MKFSYALIAGLVAASGTASAQDEALIRSVTIDDLEQFSIDQGHTILGFGEAGEISLRAETPDGLIYYLSGTACNEGSCAGINMSARFDANENVTLEIINDANLRRAAVSVWLLNGSTLGVSRYVILDGGQTMENIEVNFDNFIAIVPTVIDMFFEE